MEIKTALISVYNKDGLLDFARKLEKLGVEIIASSGTADFLRKENIKVTDISMLTKFPEILDGRVKTLHPAIHAAILAKREKKHLEELKKHGIKPIDLVIINLYPFKEKLLENKSLNEMIEFIDIGGTAMIRAAAKNSEHVAIVTNIKQYSLIIEELEKKKELSIETKRMLAAEAFALTAEYDALVAKYFREKFSTERFSEKLVLAFEKIIDLRYGENPHQNAALYKETFSENEKHSIINAKILQGKEMSFNNYLDAESAVNIVKEFKEPAAVIVKHNNPCGVAIAESIEEAFTKAYESDEVSAFGGIIALNRKCTKELAEKIVSFFNEVVIAPAFDENALEVLKQKKKVRVLELPTMDENIKRTDFDFKKLTAGLLLQDADTQKEDEKNFECVTNKKPTKQELNDLLFAWRISKHVKSNAIVLAKDMATIGIGAGQTSRIDSLMIALQKAKAKAKNAVLASDGFFPFRDSIDEASKAGITAIIQPGGSLKDKEVIEAANEKRIVMLFTRIRHFKH